MFLTKTFSSVAVLFLCFTACLANGGDRYFVGVDREIVNYAALHNRVITSGFTVDGMAGKPAAEMRKLLALIEYRASKLANIGANPTNAEKLTARNQIRTGAIHAVTWTADAPADTCETVTACLAFGTSVCSAFATSVSTPATPDGSRCQGRCEALQEQPSVLWRVRCD